MSKNSSKKTKLFFLIYLLIIILVLLIGLFSMNAYENMQREHNIQKVLDIGFSENKILSGGPPKDGIPSIDDPQFIPIADVDYIKPNELVLALEYKGETRVYPFQIVVFHEIVNDVVAGDPLAITYCPLCGTGIAYNRRVNGEVLEFGVSGKLFNSNMLMYDRQTDSLWTQIDGLGVTGDMIGTELTPIHINTVMWSEWAPSHPEAVVLSQDTGYDRPYGSDPYGDYYVTSEIWFPTENSDTSISSKEVIYGIEIDGIYKAYLETDIVANQPIVDDMAGVEVLILRDEAGEISFSNNVTGDAIIAERGFWFSWYAFHPDTLVYGRNN